MKEKRWSQEMICAIVVESKAQTMERRERSMPDRGRRDCPNPSIVDSCFETCRVQTRVTQLSVGRRVQQQEARDRCSQRGAAERVTPLLCSFLLFVVVNRATDTTTGLE